MSSCPPCHHVIFWQTLNPPIMSSFSIGWSQNRLRKKVNNGVANNLNFYNWLQTNFVLHSNSWRLLPLIFGSSLIFELSFTIVNFCHTERYFTKKLGRILPKDYWCHRLPCITKSKNVSLVWNFLLCVFFHPSLHFIFVFSIPPFIAHFSVPPVCFYVPPVCFSALPLVWYSLPLGAFLHPPPVFPCHF